MDLPEPIALTRRSLDPLESDLAEVDAAITLVLTGLATRVRLVGLRRPEMAIGPALARSQDAGVAFHLDRDEGVVLTFGPAD